MPAGMEYDERTPLLDRIPALDRYEEYAGDPHAQFCLLTGVPPSNLPKGSKAAKQFKPSVSSLYQRALRKRSSQNVTYYITACLSNSLLLSQVIIGAAVTALAASDSNKVIITVFGALNTIIAGVVAYLKSRGQPMRAQMFRDDLERVVDEIENSEIMWLGISKDMHGYDDIDIEDEVSVRTEVARLTRLYDKAVRNSVMSNPDLYHGTSATDAFIGLHSRTAQAALPAISAAVLPAVDSGATASAPIPPIPAPTAPAADPDESPASARPKPKDKDSDSGSEDGKDKGKDKDVAEDKPADTPADPKPDAAAAAPADAAPKDAKTEPAPGFVPLAQEIDEGPVTSYKKKDDDEQHDHSKNDPPK